MLNPHEHVVGIECEHETDMPLAEDVLGILVKTYPGYQWFVLVRSGVLQVKVSNWSNAWGMVLHYSDIAHDSGARAQSVKRAAGEFLERARMIRGLSTGDKATHIEGVPDKALIRV